MYTFNIEVGNFYKNYPDLCSALKESVKTSNAKKAQRKEWLRYFEWERVGHGYKIIKIHDPPKPKEQGRKKSSKYANAAYEILLYEFYKRHKLYDNDASKESRHIPKLCYKKSYLFLLLGFANNIECRIDVANNTEKLILQEVRQNCYMVFHNEINRILKNLEKRKLLRYRKTYVIVENGNEKVGNKKKMRLINNIKRKLLKKYECKSEYEIFLKNMNDDYYTMLYDDLYRYGIEYKGVAYEISVYIDKENQDNISDRLNALYEYIMRIQNGYIQEQKVLLHEHIYKYIQTSNVRAARNFLNNRDLVKSIIDEYHTKCTIELYEQLQQKFTEQLLKM